MVEETTPEVEALAKATQESLFHAMKQMVPGNHLFDVSSAVQEYVEERGYSVVREFCGHGIGQRMHEDPQVPNYGKSGNRTGPQGRLGAGGGADGQHRAAPGDN